jgi:hypothetical protein
MRIRSPFPHGRSKGETSLGNSCLADCFQPLSVTPPPGNNRHAPVFPVGTVKMVKVHDFMVRLFDAWTGGKSAPLMCD